MRCYPVLLVAGCLSIGFAASVLAASLASGARFRDCPDCPEMIVIPPGSFMMGMDAAVAKAHLEKLSAGFGAPAEPEKAAAALAKTAAHAAPVHKVTIARPFAVGVFHVTRGEYAAFVDATSWRGVPDAQGNSDCYLYGSGNRYVRDQDHPGDWREPGYNQTDLHPVTCVNWDDAHAFIAWLTKKSGKTYRLLSEAEYEYAARAGTTALYYWGDDPAAACLYGNWSDHTTVRVFGIRKSPADCNDHHLFTAPVGTFKPNPFGLYDMGGNVSGLIEDCDHPNYAGAPSDGSAWVTDGTCEQRITRGSFWNSTSSWGESAFRKPIPNVRSSESGFRVARVLD
jgi:formylglycine-generating enzyme required for sulfatase activity